MQISNRRGVLKALIVAVSGSLWAACRGGGSSDAAVPTLADIDTIQATHGAQAMTPTAQATRRPLTEEPKVEEGDESAASATSPAGRAWPSVQRGPDGVLVTDPLERFYETRYRNANPRPEIDAVEWRLTVDGWVNYPLTLSLSDIKALPQIDVMRTLECISNPVGGTLIGNTTWRGVRFAHVLAEAGIRAGAQYLNMAAADGYTTSIPLELATHTESLLVYEMNGGPLPVKHGHPLRVLLPGRYGQKQPKWITSMEVTPNEVLGYWEQRGWSNEAKVQINSQIWDPPGLADISGGSVIISGIAYSDESGVSAVEVSADNGSSWQEAELLPGPTPLIWTEWRFEWTLPSVSQPTPISLAVRATDGNGRKQHDAAGEAGLLDSTFPDGTSNIHRIVVNVQPSS